MSEPTSDLEQEIRDLRTALRDNADQVAAGWEKLETIEHRRRALHETEWALRRRSAITLLATVIAGSFPAVVAAAGAFGSAWWLSGIAVIVLGVEIYALIERRSAIRRAAFPERQDSDLVIQGRPLSSREEAALQELVLQHRLSKTQARELRSVARDRLASPTPKHLDLTTMAAWKRLYEDLYGRSKRRRRKVDDP